MDERTLNDLLECSVCLERLNTTSKVLPCQHTFCRKCLENIVSSHNELRCPECRVLIDIKIDDLPPNVLLMRILEGMKNASHNHINSSFSPQVSAKPTTSLTTRTNPSSEHGLKLLNHLNYRPSDDPQQQQRHLLLQQQQQHHLHHHPQQQLPYSSKQFTNNSIHNLPHAIAVFDYNAKENGDLTFKKGDHILLRRRIDLNWFVGELSGTEGVFPINHVQMMVPLPVPQCKAMYDFRMGPNDEEGCLTFKKGQIINVFRRVDNNWAEGRIADCIGIFPIAFVIMNPLAKQLMDNTSSLQYTISSRTIPLPPTNSNTDSSNTIQQQPQQPHHHHNSGILLPILAPFSSPASATSSSAAPSSSGSSSVTTSPNSTSSSSKTNSTSSSAPSSPISNPATLSNTQITTTINTTTTTTSTTITNLGSAMLPMSSSHQMPHHNHHPHQRHQKRHSLTTLTQMISLGNNSSNSPSSITTATTSSTSPSSSSTTTTGMGKGNAIQQMNRHSVEILSVPESIDANAVPAISGGDEITGNPNEHELSLPIRTTHKLSSRQHQQRVAAAAAAAASSNNGVSSSTSPATTKHLKNSSNQLQFIPNLPASYLALYPYKPQKSDELELKKGSVYYVTERCQDGWFKGTNRNTKSGVFPGNYVSALRHHNDAQNHAIHLKRNESLGLNNHNQHHLQQQHQQQQQQHQQSHHSNTSSGGGGGSIGAVAGCSKGSHKQSSLDISPSPGGPSSMPSIPPPELPPRSSAISGSVWSKPLGQHVESFFSSRGSKSNQPTSSNGNTTSTSSTTSTLTSSSSTTTSITTATTPSTTTNTSSTIKDKKESTQSSAVSLMKRLTNIKRSKSPTSTTTTTSASFYPAYSMDNPVFEDITITSAASNSNQCGGGNSMAPTTAALAFSKRNAQLSHPIHVRSGSCPSQLLQSLPVDMNTPSPSNDGGNSDDLIYLHGSTRIKEHKERPALHGMRTNTNRQNTSSNIENTPIDSVQHLHPSSSSHGKSKQSGCISFSSGSSGANSGHSSSHHRKSQSLDAATIAFQMASANNNTNTNNKHKVAINQRFRCIVSYPPNSEFELELNVNDIVFVHKKRDNGWYKGTHARTGKIGLFPASFVEPDI